MSALEIQKGERGRWRKKPVVSKSASSKAVGRRKVIKAAAAAAAVPRLAMNFIAWSEPRDDDEQERA